MIEAFKRSAYLNERETVRKTTTLDHIKELSEWTNAIPHEMLEKRLGSFDQRATNVAHRTEGFTFYKEGIKVD